MKYLILIVAIASMLSCKKQITNDSSAALQKESENQFIYNSDYVIIGLTRSGSTLDWETRIYIDSTGQFIVINKDSLKQVELMRILRTGSERYFPAFLTFPDSQSGRAFWQSQHLFFKYT